MLRRLAFAVIRIFGHSTWLPLGLRYRLARLLVHPERTPDHVFSVPFFGRRYTGNFANLIDWTVYFLGAYEPSVLAFLDAVCRGAASPCPIYLDVGANVGHHVLFMAGRARVHAFEPYEPLADQINRKIADNALTGVTVHTIALGDRDESRSYYAPTGHNLGTGTFLTEVGDRMQRDAGPHVVVRGDTYLATHRIAPVALVKIDVEGFEPYVLKGLRETLIRDRPVVQMEWSQTTAREFAAMERRLPDLLPERYAFRQILGSGARGYRLAPVEGTPPIGELACIPSERLADILLRKARPNSFADQSPRPCG